jgi:uncharacterized membrane protein
MPEKLPSLLAQPFGIALARGLHHGLGVEYARLAAAGCCWFLLHAAVAGSGLRGVLVARFADKGYRSAFSLASVASLWWLIAEYGHARYAPLWLTPAWLYWVPAVLVPVALVFLVGAFTVPSPTAVGGEKLLGAPEPARGMLRITRHPFLWSAVIWSLAHGLVNADAASLLFFGSLGVTALRGTFDIDRKRRRSSPDEYARFEAVTSNVPFAALLSGRTRLVARELVLPVALGLAVAVVSVALHPRFFGTSALPMLSGR